MLRPADHVPRHHHARGEVLSQGKPLCHQVSDVPAHQAHQGLPEAAADTGSSLGMGETRYRRGGR
jgi:hypothetical protein